MPEGNLAIIQSHAPTCHLCIAMHLGSPNFIWIAAITSGPSHTVATTAPELRKATSFSKNGLPSCSAGAGTRCMYAWGFRQNKQKQANTCTMQQMASDRVRLCTDVMQLSVGPRSISAASGASTGKAAGGRVGLRSLVQLLLVRGESSAGTSRPPERLIHVQPPLAGHRRSHCQHAHRMYPVLWEPTCIMFGCQLPGGHQNFDTHELVALLLKPFEDVHHLQTISEPRLCFVAHHHDSYTA